MLCGDSRALYPEPQRGLSGTGRGGQHHLGQTSWDIHVRVHNLGGAARRVHAQHG